MTAKALTEKQLLAITAANQDAILSRLTALEAAVRAVSPGDGLLVIAPIHDADTPEKGA